MAESAASKPLMNPEPDTSASAPGPVPTATPASFDLEPIGKPDHRWRLELRPGDLALFEGDDPQPFVLLRERMPKDVMLVEGMNALVLNKPKKLTFKLAPEATRAIADWIGKPMLAAFYLKRRYLWILPVAFIWFLGSLPYPGNPDTGLEPKPLDVMGMGLAVTLVVAWGFAKWRPHPVLFLVDSLWFLWLAAYLIRDILHGRSLWWGILVILLLRMTVTGFKHFARFRGTRMAAS
jgi:hypothetical protein